MWSVPTVLEAYIGQGNLASTVPQADHPILGVRN